MEAKKNKSIFELETRGYRRVDTQHQARFTLKGGTRDWNECIIININNDLKGLGIRFKAREEIKVNSLVIIDLLSTDDLEPIHIKGTLMWIKQTGDDFESRLIDLEKTKPRFFRNTGMNRDLDSFNRHAYGWSRTDRLRFLHYYLSAAGLEHKLAEMWSMLARRQVKRSERR